MTAIEPAPAAAKEELLCKASTQLRKKKNAKAAKGASVKIQAVNAFAKSGAAAKAVRELASKVERANAPIDAAARNLCSFYAIDLLATFGTCKCGAPKAAHSPEALEAGALKRNGVGAAAASWKAAAVASSAGNLPALDLSIGEAEVAEVVWGRLRMLLSKPGGPLIAVETFRSIDTNGNGNLDVPEFKSLLEKLNITNDIPGGAISESALLAVVRAADKDGDGTVCYKVNIPSKS